MESHAGMTHIFLNMRVLAQLDSCISILVSYKRVQYLLLRSFFVAASDIFMEAARMDGVSDFQELSKFFISLDDLSMRLYFISLPV